MVPGSGGIDFVASAFRRQSSWHARCSILIMAHPYPAHMDDFSYVGKYRYFLTFCTHDRKAYFRNADTVDLVRTQILRAARQYQFLDHCVLLHA